MLNLGVAIETEVGKFMIVDNDNKCDYYYSLINLDNGRIAAMDNNPNNFRVRMGI